MIAAVVKTFSEEASYTTVYNTAQHYTKEIVYGCTSTPFVKLLYADYLLSRLAHFNHQIKWILNPFSGLPQSFSCARMQVSVVYVTHSLYFENIFTITTH